MKEPLDTAEYRKAAADSALAGYGADVPTRRAVPIGTWHWLVHGAGGA